MILFFVFEGLAKENNCSQISIFFLKSNFVIQVLVTELIK